MRILTMRCQVCGDLLPLNSDGKPETDYCQKAECQNTPNFWKAVGALPWPGYQPHVTPQWVPGKDKELALT